MVVTVIHALQKSAPTINVDTQMVKWSFTFTEPNCTVSRSQLPIMGVKAGGAIWLLYKSCFKIFFYGFNGIFYQGSNRKNPQRHNNNPDEIGQGNVY